MWSIASPLAAVWSIPPPLAAVWSGRDHRSGLSSNEGERLGEWLPNCDELGDEILPKLDESDKWSLGDRGPLLGEPPYAGIGRGSGLPTGLAGAAGIVDSPDDGPSLLSGEFRE